MAYNEASNSYYYYAEHNSAIQPVWTIPTHATSPPSNQEHGASQGYGPGWANKFRFRRAAAIDPAQNTTASQPPGPPVRACIPTFDNSTTPVSKDNDPPATMTLTWPHLTAASTYLQLASSTTRTAAPTASTKATMGSMQHPQTTKVAKTTTSASKNAKASTAPVTNAKPVAAKSASFLNYLLARQAIFDW